MIVFDITIPTCWQELSPKQLRYVFWLLSEGYSATAIRTYAFFRWSQIEILEHADGVYQVKYQGQFGTVTAADIAAAMRPMAWLDQLPVYPVRPSNMGTHTQALPADFQGVPFEKFLYCENLYQGWLRTKQEKLLWQLAAVLYQSAEDELPLEAEDKVAVFYWFASLKQFLARQFPNFFSSSAGATTSTADIARLMQEQMNTQIRALTKGDITKEQVVLEADTWRALAELDAQAKEYEELKKSSHS